MGGSRTKALTWRDVLSPKRQYLDIKICHELAWEAGYRWFVFHTKIYEVKNRDIYEETSLDILLLD